VRPSSVTVEISAAAASSIDEFRYAGKVARRLKVTSCDRPWADATLGDPVRASASRASAEVERRSDIPSAYVLILSGSWTTGERVVPMGVQTSRASANQTYKLLPMMASGGRGPFSHSQVTRDVITR